jgi:CheY-like chemotaxis protein
LRRIRALGDERGGNTPAIALTAFARKEDRRRVLNAGYSEHLAKPVEAAKLVATVAAVATRDATNA